MKKKVDKKNKTLYTVIGIVVLVLACSIGFYKVFTIIENKETNAEKFAREYSIDNDNVFVYRTLEEINKILKNGTGIVYLGFPECPWCKGYEKPEDYWKNEDLDGLKNRLSKMINDVSFDYCTTDCNK